MASKSNRSLLLFAAVLVAVFATVAAVITSEEYCSRLGGIPSNPIPSCRNYVLEQACGIDMPGPPYLAKQTCCEEFVASIPHPCRCQALRYFIGPKAHPEQSGLMELPGCPREVQMDLARVLVAPAYCNLTTIQNAPYCLDMDESQWNWNQHA